LWPSAHPRGDVAGLTIHAAAISISPRLIVGHNSRQTRAVLSTDARRRACRLGRSWRRRPGWCDGRVGITKRYRSPLVPAPVVLWHAPAEATKPWLPERSIASSGRSASDRRQSPPRPPSEAFAAGSVG